MRASRRTATGQTVPAAILRDGRASKSAVADFDTLTLPKSGKPDFGERGLLRIRSEGLISIVRSDWFHGIYLLAGHSGLMPFSSMNFVQFLISLSSLPRNAGAGAKSGAMSRFASRSRTCGSDMTVALAFSSFDLTGSGIPFGPNRPNQNRKSTSAPFTPASAMVGTAGIAGDRAMLVTAKALIWPDSTKLFVA